MKADVEQTRVESTSLEGYVGPKQVAKFLDKSLNYVYENANKSALKPIPTLRKGKYLFFKLSEVARWLEDTSEKI